MIENILLLSLMLFMLAIALLLYRVILGPSNPDRAIALDTIGVNLISSIALSTVYKLSLFFCIIL